MNGIIDHTIIRARPNTPGLPTGGSNGSANSSSGGTAPVDSFTRSAPILDASNPDYSGFTNFSRGQLLAVRDSKLESNDDRVLLVDKSDGKVSPVAMDWSKTGKARDLEAVAPGAGNGQFLAVEGSSFGDTRARLFEMSIGENGGTAEKTHVLPEFGQEIEGMVSVKGENGNQTVLFAGRGGNGMQGRVFWGELGAKGLEFSKEGMAGQAVQAPHIGEGQRDIGDMAVDKQGNLWASAAMDQGDDGPFTSAVYQLGKLTPGGAAPFEAKLGQSFKLDHIKAEALSMQAGGKMFVGSDNESAGGRFESIVI